MPFPRLIAAVALSLITTFAPAQLVQEAWQINPSNAAATGNAWLATPNAGHAIDVVAASAAQNTHGRDVLVLLTEETANAKIRVLDAATGQHMYTFSTTPTGDSFREHSRMATSEDGYIYVSSGAGIVQQYELNGTFLGNAVTAAKYSGDSGTCRALAVTGSHTANTLKIFAARGSSVVVFGNGTGSAVSRMGKVVTGMTGDIMALSAAGNRVYAASIPTPETKLFLVNFAPFSHAAAQPVSPLATATKYSFAVTPDQSRMAVALRPAAISECAVGNLNAAGTVLENIPAAATVDLNSNGLYDGGPGRGFATLGATPDICIAADGKSVYAYFPHYDPPAAAPSAAIIKLTVSGTSDVPGWMLY